MSKSKKSKMPAWRRRRNAKIEAIQKKLWEIRVALLVAVTCMVIVLLPSKDQFRIAFFYDSVNFHKTSAKIIESNRTRYSSSTGKASRVVYASNISYEFTIDGITYISDSFQLDESTKEFSTSRKADQLLSKYPKGAKVNIFYEKGNPTLSFIELKGQKYVLLFYIVFTFVSLFFFLRAFLFYRKLDDSNKDKVFRFIKS